MYVIIWFWTSALYLYVMSFECCSITIFVMLRSDWGRNNLSKIHQSIFSSEKTFPASNFKFRSITEISWGLFLCTSWTLIISCTLSSSLFFCLQILNITVIRYSRTFSMEYPRKMPKWKYVGMSCDRFVLCLCWILWGLKIFMLIYLQTLQSDPTMFQLWMLLYLQFLCTHPDYTENIV